MSWFDTSGIANIAKTALKEAQRTIDKALDIKDEDIAAPANTPIDTNSDDFFGTWGLSQPNNLRKEQGDVVTKSPTKSNKTSSSLWGSFTGSFFEPHKDEFRKHPRDSVDSLDDSVDAGLEQFNRCKLVVHSNDESEKLADSEPTFEFDQIDMETSKLSDVTFDAINLRKKERNNTTHVNRLSVISSESDKKSSESVEILSCGTGSTTSPDSDMVSISSSALESKPNSESVEIIPNSLASPSSVEIILDSSRRHSQNTDEFVSPLQSPLKSSFSPEKMTPDSVEVIPEDVDESSIADDTMSYNSISESTATTILDAFSLHTKTKIMPQFIPESTNENASMDASLSPEKIVNILETPITRAPSRGGMHLPLQSNLIDTQPHSYKQDITKTIQPSNIIDIPQDNESVKSQSSEIEDGSQSDKTLVASDGLMESSSDTSTTTESNINSLYLKNLLADAMKEKREADSAQETLIDLAQSLLTGKNQLDNITIEQLFMPQRETSPISSESRSDMVKIGSDHTSAHTSGDELETTTSSDIEIISSPNGGDSSSTQSRHSPAKLLLNTKTKTDTNIDALLGKMTFKKMKGHNRELSEASSVSDESEIDRMVKRLSEMTEILESREMKLVDISRKNSELQEMNNNLRKQMDIIINKQLESMDVNQVTEEYTQRLSALERKFQQAIRDKDSLRKQLEQAKVENASKMSKSELDSLIEEKDQIIKELREEGEKLSKQQLQHSNIIKKLRAKEKELETSIKHLKESVEDLSSESDRLKRSLAAKEEVERSQIEAVHQLSSKNKKYEIEIEQLNCNFEDIVQKYDTVKKSLEAAKKELIDKNRANTELVQREQALQTLENEKRMMESQNEEILNQLEDLRSKLQDANEDYLKKEQHLRSENMELLRRLEDAECRNEELAQSVLEVSKPLVRQLETLQATHNMKLASFQKIEQDLNLKINDIQTKFHTTSESEKIAKDECTIIKSKIISLENQLSSYKQMNEKLKDELNIEKTNSMMKEAQLRKEIDLMSHKLSNERENESIIMKLQSEIESLQEMLFDISSRDSSKINPLICSQELEEKKELSQDRTSPTISGNMSPALSIGKTSLASQKSVIWPFDDASDNPLVSKCTNMLEMQVLSSNLKQRDGEVQQLQWELTRREHERTLLNTEISNLLTRIENLEIKCNNHDLVQKEFLEIQQKYETLCQLYGEKVEETEELKLDLQEVKEMYKAQIDELSKSLSPSS